MPKLKLSRTNGRSAHKDYRTPTQERECNKLRNASKRLTNVFSAITFMTPNDTVALMNNKPTQHYTPHPQIQSQPLLKVALDVHLAFYVAAIQEDGAHPKPPQRFKPADFLCWIDKQGTR